MIIKNLQKNIENAKRILVSAIKNISLDTHCSCEEALKYAIVTDKKMIPAKIKKDLKIIIGKYL